VRASDGRSVIVCDTDEGWTEESAQVSGSKFCPCYGHITVSDEYEACDICCWKYDPFQDTHPGGPNMVSLREAQQNFAQFGAKSAKYRDFPGFQLRRMFTTESGGPSDARGRLETLTTRRSDTNRIPVMHLLTCPCCGYKTISDSYEICEICAWEYDPYAQNIHPDEGGGPNPMSLREAQRNFAKIGAKGEMYLDMVTAPLSEDQKDAHWHPFEDP
jgi:hypothetical protein